MPRATGGPPLILSVSNGVHDRHHVFRNVRAAIKSAETFAGAGYRVALMAATGQVVMTLARRVEA